MAMATSSSVTLNLSSFNRQRRTRSNGVAFASLSSNTETAQGIELTEGLGSLPKVVLTSLVEEMYLFGGCITSWKVPSEKDMLYVRPDGCGVPHCFPQFGPGAIQQHGFARNSNWSVANSENVEGDPIITLELMDSPYSRVMWDFSFQALFKIILKLKSLSTVLTITNTESKPFSFSNALHKYFRVSSAGASVKGLKGCKTLNKDPDPVNPLEVKEERDSVTFPGFVDCIYLNAPNEIHLDNGLGDIVSIKNTNWSDAVLWNPYLTMEARYKEFVCVENGQIGEVKLEPKQSWVAEQQMSIG